MPVIARIAERLFRNGQLYSATDRSDPWIRDSSYSNFPFNASVCDRSRTNEIPNHGTADTGPLPMLSISSVFVPIRSWGSLWRWSQKPEPDPKLLSRWPLARLPKWVERVNDPLTAKELDAVRLSAQRGRPLGDDVCVASIAARLHLESTIRPRGRQQVRSTDNVPIKHA